MSHRLLVHLDLRRIRLNLSAEEGRDVSDAEVKRWLTDAAFEPRGDGWLVKEADLGQVLPEEVIAVQGDPQSPPDQQEPPNCPDTGG
jgi:hypothetical protein